MTTAPADGFRLAVAQSVSGWDDLGGNVAAHLALCRRAAELGARIVVFPELSLSGYPEARGPQAVEPGDRRLGPLRDLATDRDLVIVAGAPVRAGADLRIAALVLRPDGDLAIAFKSRLHPGEERVFAPGPGLAPLAVAGERIGLAICAEAGDLDHGLAAQRAGASIYAISALVSRQGFAEARRRCAALARQSGLLVVQANHGAPSGPFESAGRTAAWTGAGEVAMAPDAGPAIVLVDRVRGAWRGEVVAMPQKA